MGPSLSPHTGSLSQREHLATLLRNDSDAVGSNARLFLIIAIIAEGLGFTGIAGVATSIAQIHFELFLVLFMVSPNFGRR